MKYDFDEIVNRRGTNSVKWDEAKEEGVIPMWVADMDFKAAPCILEALKKRVDHGVFGYTIVPDSYYESIISWFERRHQWHIERDWIIYTSGVVTRYWCRRRYTIVSSRLSETMVVRSPRMRWCAKATRMKSTLTTLRDRQQMRRQKCSCSAILTTQPDECGHKRS